MRRIAIFTILVLCAAPMVSVFGQYKEVGFEVGIHGGAAIDQSTGIHDPIAGAMIGIDLAFPLFPALQLELSGSWAELRAKTEIAKTEIRTEMIPVDLKLKLAPFKTPGFIPYIFAGAGVLNYNHEKQGSAPDSVWPGTPKDGWAFYVPAGVGMTFKISSRTAFDIRGAYNYSTSEHVTPDPDDDPDAFVSALVGLRITGGPSNPDLDGDELLNKDEKRVGTDMRNPDTDADTLLDGEEQIHLNTNPLAGDTDSDGLGDYAEAKRHNTDPLKSDTDGEGLSDGEEVNQYRTNPLKPDGDDDGLRDHAEVHDTHTDPNKSDSDGDGLSDGAEVNRHKTDPLKQDTDGGTIADGLEVERGSNPLDPSDDMQAPPPPVIIFEMDKPVVLEGINFAFNSSEILPESEKILNQAHESMHAHPEIVVEISGHTDSKGSNEYNQRLSERRANAVRNWMMNHGIDGSRMVAVGNGEERPVASNETEDGRLRNRRIEFKRIR